MFTIQIPVSRMTATFTCKFTAALPSIKVYSQEIFNFKMESSSMLPPTTWFYSCLKLKSQPLTITFFLALTLASYQESMRMITWPIRVFKTKPSKRWSTEFWRAKTRKTTITKAQLLISTITGSLKSRLSSTTRGLQTGVIISLEPLVL